MSAKEKLQLDNIPRHIAVIMDGNGRWAQRQGQQRIFGHRNAVQAVRNVTEACAELGVQHLTLYAFSTENWGRPKDEVAGLMELFVHTIRQEVDTLIKNKIRLTAIGDISGMPVQCQRELKEAQALTAHNAGLNLVLALNYSGRWEILQAVKQLAGLAKENLLDPETITEDTIHSQLSTAGMPDPELLIRTSGEMRLSNFLLWQLAYTEIYISDTLWPDFDKETLYEALESYQQRNRRFGKVVAA